jgi:hypothetical protein
MFKYVFFVCALTAAMPYSGSAQATVRVKAETLQGPRPLQEQTGKAAIRDYVQSWQCFTSAFEQNRTDLLSLFFVGTARDKLVAAIQQQTALGISTRYQDRTHDIQIVFYSPDGLSIEMTDAVEYDVQLLDHGRVKTEQRVISHYVIVLTPAEVRWKVRVFQAEPN